MYTFLLKTEEEGGETLVGMQNSECKTNEQKTE